VTAAQAGLRISMQEPVRDSITQLAMDYFGSLFPRLPALNPKPQDLQFAQNNYVGWDDLRRRSVRGDVFAQAVADVLAADLNSMDVSAFHRDVAEKISYRPGHISVLARAAGGSLPVTLTIVDSLNHVVGGVDDKGKVAKQIPFSDYLIFQSGGNAPSAQMAFLVAPAQGDYAVHLHPHAGA